MKLVVFCCCVVVTLSKMTTEAATDNVMVIDDGAVLKRSYMDCIEETHVKPELVKKFRAGSWANHPSLKKWALCVLVRTGLMSNEGVYQYDVAMARVRDDDRDEVDKLLNKCLSKKKRPPQEIAWKYLKCHHSKDRLNNFPTLGITHTF